MPSLTRCLRHGFVWLIPALLLVVAPALAQAPAPAPAPAAALAQAPAPAAAGAAARRTVEATRLGDGESIVLDGRLDEAVWARALPAKDFVQVEPRNGQPATEPTEVRIAFSADAIYLGVTNFDSEPDRVFSYQRRRDELLGADDKFRWTIDTFLDARTGYFFEMNSEGAMSDALLGSTGQNRSWDGIWNGKVAHSEIGWTIEVEIPFRTVNFHPDNDTWGINFDRGIGRKNETTIWMGWARNQGLQRMTNAGRVTGIRNVTQGLGLDVKPYGLFTAQASPGRGKPDLDTDREVGVDMFYNLTPGVRANLTVNTDFAQTEVDQRQVNLTRFSLFFPERRDFFLDGATFFDFAGSGTSADGGTEQVIPFFSRRIGLSSSATPQRIDFGAKITGQVGRQDLGVLQVRTGEDNGTPGEAFTVARLKRRLLRQSFVGLVYTRRDAPDDSLDASQTIGADLQLATSTFLGSQNLTAAAWWLRSMRPGVTDQNNAMGMYVAYPNDRWSGQVRIREVQRNFDPAVGFVTRRAFRRYNPTLEFAPRPRNHPYIRRYEFGVEADVLTDLDNRLLERALNFQLLEVTFHAGDMFGVEVTPTYERLDEPFAIRPGIVLPAESDYSYTRYLLRGQTAGRRRASLTGSIEGGGFYTGNRLRSVLGLTLRARPGYILTFNGEWNQIELTQGHFSTNVIRVVGETQFRPFLTLVNNVQYDTQSAVMGWQSRFRWIMRPGNDLYVVYTHNWLDDPTADRFRTLDKRFATKVLYTHRF